MALGIEQNSIAPQLIQNSGQALVQGIRQIGQQISGHLTEMQTKKDLAALAQETQGLNVESVDFPVQLTQLVSRHPMAVRDERGQMALSILGKAHGAWQASQADALAFQRQMKMLETRGAQAKSQFEYEEAARGKRPMFVPGVGLVQPGEIDEVTGQPKVLVPAAPRPGSNRPIVANPGDIVFDTTGKEIARNTNPRGSSSEITKQRFNFSLLNTQESSLRSEINSAMARLDAAEKEQAKILEDLPTVKGDANKLPLNNRFKEVDAKKQALVKEINDMKSRRAKLLESIGAIQSRIQEGGAAEVEPELGPVPAGAAAPAGVLPPTGAVVPASATQVRRIPVIDPQGNPMQLRQDQVDAALQAGWKLR